MTKENFQISCWHSSVVIFEETYNQIIFLNFYFFIKHGNSEQKTKKKQKINKNNNNKMNEEKIHPSFFDAYSFI